MKSDIIVDVRGLGVLKRISKVKKAVKNTEKGKIIDVIADDPRMPKLAEKMAKKIKGIEVIEVKKIGEDYHGYFRRI